MLDRDRWRTNAPNRLSWRAMARSTALRTASWSKNAWRTEANDPPPGRPLPLFGTPAPLRDGREHRGPGGHDHRLRGVGTDARLEHEVAVVDVAHALVLGPAR